MASIRFLMFFLLAALLVTALATVGNDFVTWIRGNIATVFFTVAIVLAGFAAAFNKISWMWVLMIAVGALLVFGAPGFVADLKAVFS